MTTNKETAEKKLFTYTHLDYSIKMDANWEVKKINENQTFFFGPKVGKARVGFYITSINKDGKDYLYAAERIKEDQSLEKDYKLIEESDLSKNGYKAFMRRSYWYNEEIDMSLFVRDVFTESTNKIFILSCSIPNSPELVGIDKTLVQMMNSFKFSLS